MLKYLDSILLGLWTIIKSCIAVAIQVLIFIAPIVKAFFELLFKLPFLRGVGRVTNKFIHLQIWAQLFKKLRIFSSYFSDKMIKFKIFRRIVFLIAAIMLLFYIYPYSHWGPWYKYQTGTASYYSSGFWFKQTANGERFIPLFYTAAHKTLPFGITIKVVNPANGKTVYVRVNDRGPFVKGRILDLSSAAAKKIGIYKSGTGKVIIYTHKKW